MTVGELKERMSSTEYTQWIALHNLRAKEAEKRQRELSSGRKKSEDEQRRAEAAAKARVAKAQAAVRVATEDAERLRLIRCLATIRERFWVWLFYPLAARARIGPVKAVGGDRRL